MISSRQHPIPAEDIGAGLAIDIVDICTADPGILVQDIVQLRFEDKAVLKQISTDIGVPKDDRCISGKGAGLLLPGVEGGSIDLIVP